MNDDDIEPKEEDLKMTGPVLVFFVLVIALFIITMGYWLWLLMETLEVL